MYWVPSERLGVLPIIWKHTHFVGYELRRDCPGLSPEQWDRILDFLRGRTGLYVGQEADCRRFVEAVPRS